MSMALHRNIGAFVKTQAGIDPEDSAAQTINGAAIDRQGYLSSVLHHACGAASGSPTAQTVATKLQDSADGSTGWADVSGAAATDLTADDTEDEVDIDLSGAKRYLRAATTVSFTAGTTPSIPVAATLVLAGKDELPA